ncbi:MAG: hypothetical protein ACJA1D_001842 [Polaribacter sp.]|jgi:hypothetical protein
MVNNKKIKRVKNKTSGRTTEQRIEQSVKILSAIRNAGINLDKVKELKLILDDYVKTGVSCSGKVKIMERFIHYNLTNNVNVECLTRLSVNP